MASKGARFTRRIPCQSVLCMRHEPKLRLKITFLVCQPICEKSVQNFLFKVETRRSFLSFLSQSSIIVDSTRLMRLSMGRYWPALIYQDFLFAPSLFFVTTRKTTIFLEFQYIKRALEQQSSIGRFSSSKILSSFPCPPSKTAEEAPWHKVDPPLGFQKGASLVRTPSQRACSQNHSERRQPSPSPVIPSPLPRNL
jgi:hypothetical protein